jgi:cytochrome c peroxidase
MKRAYFCQSRAFVRVLSTVITFWMLVEGVAWGVTVIPPPTLFPLNQIAVPQPPNLFQFVKSRNAAILLGKALFWDMQAGSDGIQACASCHFSAGADNRLKNSVNPGFDNLFKVRGINETLLPGDFPFHQRQSPDFQTPIVIVRDSNDIVGSQGVRFTEFVNIVAGSDVENGSFILDPIFNVSGVNTRRVTDNQAPTVINAIFNLNNFWDGRAHFVFNGVNPFGTLDPSAGVWFNNNGTLVKQAIAIQFASLASQATGPPLNDTEMSYHGRTFPQLGRKMLSLTPLGKQLVHPNDSELGLLSKAVQQPNGSMTGDKGLSISYTQMIKDAFLDKFWNSNQLTPDGYTQMEANFSLYWGLAIQLYEATLVSDQTPFDQFLGGDQTALTDLQKDGFNTFFGVGGCAGCHFGTELTSASVRSSAFLSNASHALIEPMMVVSGLQIIYDLGYNNTAVRPTTEDIARGADSPFLNPLNIIGGIMQPFPLSFSALAELQALGTLGFNKSLFPLGAPVTPILPPNIPANFPVANNGNFKVPGLRNVELTAPYFHNGGDMTLDTVVQFYTRGGNFRLENQDSLDILIADIAALQGNTARQANLVAFMKSFTDERVRNESGPFDHPEIFIPNGDPEIMIRLPAKDINGVAAPSLPTVTLNPVTTPTGQTSQLISGTKEAGATIQVKVNNGQAFPADTATNTTWSTTVTGLVLGSNTITVTATDTAGGVTNLTANILSTVMSGAIVINGGAAFTRSPSVTLTLTSTTAAWMQFSKDGVTFFPFETFAGTRVLTLLPGDGLKTITVRFKDLAGNVSAPVSASITLNTTNPTGIMTINGGAAFTRSASVTLSLTVADTVAVTQMQFSNDGVKFFPYETFAATRVVTLPPGDGLKTMTARVKDAAGNVSAPISASITLDTTPPAGTISFATPTTPSVSGTLALTATDANSATQMQFSRNGVNFFPLEPFSTSRTVSLVPGLNTLTVRFKDGAGNLSAPISATITRL